MRIPKTVLFVLVCIVLVCAVFLNSPGSAIPVSADEENEQNRISVNGSADVMVVPDEVVITLGVESIDRSISKAKDDNDGRVKRINSIAKELGIEAKNIKMDYLNIRPCDMTQRNYDGWYYGIEPGNLGYVVRKKIIVTLKDLGKFEQFVTEVLKNGVEYVQDVEFKTTELRKHKDTARELAVKAAREKADAMAAALGQNAGKAINVTEQEEYYWSWYDSWYSGWNGSGSSSMLANNVQNVVSAGTQPNTGDVTPGQIKVQARVHVEFTLN